MNKKFSPKFLRQFIVLSLFLKFLFTFSQTASISLEVSWLQWSTENRVELYSPNNVKLLTIEDSRGYSVSGTSTSFSGTFAPTLASIPVDDNVSAGSGYYIILYDAYGDDCNGTSFLNITVDGQTALTFNGDFTTNASANTEITQREYFAVEAADDASFSYAKTTFCQSETDPIPTITGESGETFSSISGLSINSSTGAIDVSASSTGNYVVTYITSNPGQNSLTQNITIFDSSSVSMSYPFSFATQDDQDLTPTLVGSGETFSSTSGLDEGLDAALFGENDPNLDVFTNLVSEENNLQYALQALPTLNYENLIIPVGVNAKAKTTLHFNANIQNLPKGIHIYLEDKETNTFTKLDENSTRYSVLISEDIFGKGRFYLHAQNPSVLSESTVLKENEVINVFTKKGQLYC